MTHAEPDPTSRAKGLVTWTMRFSGAGVMDSPSSELRRMTGTSNPNLQNRHIVGGHQKGIHFCPIKSHLCLLFYPFCITKDVADCMAMLYVLSMFILKKMTKILYHIQIFYFESIENRILICYQQSSGEMITRVSFLPESSVRDWHSWSGRIALCRLGGSARSTYHPSTMAAVTMKQSDTTAM